MRQSSSSTPSSSFTPQPNSVYHPPPPPHQHHPSTFPSSLAQPPRSSVFHSPNQQLSDPAGLPLLPLPRKFECIEPDLDPRSTFGETTYVYSFLPPGHVSSLVPASSGSIAGAEADAAATAVLDSVPTKPRVQQTNRDRSIGSDEDENEKDSDVSDDGSGHGSRTKNAQSVEFDLDGGQTPEDIARRLGDSSQIEIKHRRRTSRFQLNTLEETFLTNPKPTGTQRKELGSKLDMSPRAVQVWFQNRRAKVKNQAKKAAELQAKGLIMPLLRDAPYTSSYPTHPTESSVGRSGNMIMVPSPGEIVPKNPRSRYPSEADGYSFTSGRTSIDGSSPSTPGSMLLNRIDLSSSGTTSGSLANTHRQYNGASPQLSSSGSGWGQLESSSSSSSSSLGASGTRIGSTYSPLTDSRNQLGIGRRQSAPSYELANDAIGRQEEALSGSISGSLKAGLNTLADTYSSLAGENKSVGGPAAGCDATTRPSSVDRLQGRPESGQLWNGLHPIAPTGMSFHNRQSEQSAMLPPPVPAGSHHRPSVGSSSSSTTRHAPYNPSFSTRRASVPTSSTSTSASASTPATSSFFPPASATGNIPWNLTSIEDHENTEVYTQIPPMPPPLSDFSQLPPPSQSPSQFDFSYRFSPESYSIPTQQPHSYQQAQQIFQPLPMQRSQQPQHHLHYQQQPQQQLFQQYQQHGGTDSSYMFQSSSVTPVPQSQQQQRQQQLARPHESLLSNSLLFGSAAEMERTVPLSEARIDGTGSQTRDGSEYSDSAQRSRGNYGYQEHTLETQPSSELTNGAWHHVQGNQYGKKEPAPAQLSENFSSMSVLALRDGNVSYLQNYSTVEDPAQGTIPQTSSMMVATPFSSMQSSAAGSMNQNLIPDSQLQLPVYEPFKQEQRDGMDQELSDDHRLSLRSYQHPLFRSQASEPEPEADHSSGSHVRVDQNSYSSYSNLQRMPTMVSSDNSYLSSALPTKHQHHQLSHSGSGSNPAAGSGSGLGNEYQS